MTISVFNSEAPQNLLVPLQIRYQILSFSLRHLGAIMLHRLLESQGRSDT